MLRKLAVAIVRARLDGRRLGVGTPAQAQGVQVGVLTCNVASGFGFVFGSSGAVNCTFSPAGGPPQHYTGAINKFGVDIGYLQGGVIVWTVVAPTANLAPGSLAGLMPALPASATVGVGVGANVLVGGSSNSIALQPVSIEGTHRPQCRGRHRRNDLDLPAGLIPADGRGAVASQALPPTGAAAVVLGRPARCARVAKIGDAAEDEPLRFRSVASSLEALA